MAKPKLFDYILYTLALLISILLIFTQSTKGKASLVTIKTEEKEYQYALNKDRVISVLGEEGITEIEIKDNKVKVLSSTCKNKDCIKRGEIDNSGESIICLPNKVVITIKGKAEEEIDAISI